MGERRLGPWQNTDTYEANKRAAEKNNRLDRWDWWWVTDTVAYFAILGFGFALGRAWPILLAAWRQIAWG